MTRGRDKKDEPGSPIIRRAPLAELRIYEISEAELNALAQGSPASILLNFSLFLMPISVTLVVTLTTTRIDSARLFVSYVAVAILTLVLGALFLVLWWRLHRSSSKLVQQIRDRMPPPLIQDRPGIPVDFPR